MAYTLDRDAAAKELGISTRTLDRHIKAGKIRSKKVGKKVFLHDDDIALQKASPSVESNSESEVTYSRASSEFQISDNETIIMDDVNSVSQDEISFFPEKPAPSKFRRKALMVDYRELYEDARKSITSKDQLIQELSYKAGKAEADLKNSISLLEYKKTTFLLESAKVKSEEDEKRHAQEVEMLQKEVKKEKMVSAFLLAATILLFIACAAIWFFAL